MGLQEMFKAFGNDSKPPPVVKGDDYWLEETGLNVNVEQSSVQSLILQNVSNANNKQNLLNDILKERDRKMV